MIVYQAKSLQSDGSSITIAEYDSSDYSLLQVQNFQPTATSIELFDQESHTNIIVWQLTIAQELQIEADIQSGTATNTEKTIWSQIKSFFGF